MLSERKENVKNNERRRSMFMVVVVVLVVVVYNKEEHKEKVVAGFGGTGRFAKAKAQPRREFMNVGARSHQKPPRRGVSTICTQFSPKSSRRYQDQDQNYATSRADAMQNVERTITELAASSNNSPRCQRTRRDGHPHRRKRPRSPLTSPLR